MHSRVFGAVLLKQQKSITHFKLTSLVLKANGLVQPRLEDQHSTHLTLMITVIKLTWTSAMLSAALNHLRRSGFLSWTLIQCIITKVILSSITNSLLIEQYITVTGLITEQSRTSASFISTQRDNSLPLGFMFQHFIEVFWNAARTLVLCFILFLILLYARKWKFRLWHRLPFFFVCRFNLWHTLSYF